MKEKVRCGWPVVALLILGLTFFSFARPSPGATEKQKDLHATERVAIQRSVTLIEASARQWRADCVSCHHHALELVTTSAARSQHFAVDYKLLLSQQEAIENALARSQSKMIDALNSKHLPPPRVSPNPAMIFGYSLFGLAETGAHPDESVDIALRYLTSLQQPSGNWKCEVRQRPPFEASDFAATAVMASAEERYGMQLQPAMVSKTLKAARNWFINASALDTEDLTFSLLGLHWTGAQQEAIRRVATTLLLQQRPDGGWAQNQALASDAYATGEALVALRASGALDRNSPAFKKGVGYLLSVQAADGSWHVKSRANPIQKYFETGFPYGKDQFISYAASCWATLALLSDAHGSAIE